MGHHDEVVSWSEHEILMRVDDDVLTSAHREQRRRMVGAHHGGESINIHLHPVIVKAHPIELRTGATGDDVGDHVGESGIERRASHEP